MKLTVTQENLSQALAVVGRIAGSRTPLPILNNILLKTDKNRLLLAATNLEIAITQHIGAKVESEGSITVPARLLGEFISNLPKSNINIEADGTNLKITAGRYDSTIHGMLPDEFPALPEINNGRQVAIPAARLKRAITQTVPVVSRDETRPILTGIFFHTAGKTLTLVATDGYRLAERKVDKLDGEVNAIVPAQTLQDVVRVMPEESELVELLFDDNQVRFLLGDIEITSRLIDGNFPDYKQLIPKKSDTEAILAKEDFARVTKIASLFARESGGSVTIKADASLGQLQIHSVASQLGENTSTADAEITGEGQVTLNSRYLLEALGCVDEDNVRFAFSGKLAPCVLSGVQNPKKQSSDYLHIIMPLKS